MSEMSWAAGCVALLLYPFAMGVTKRRLRLMYYRRWTAIEGGGYFTLCAVHGLQRPPHDRHGHGIVWGCRECWCGEMVPALCLLWPFTAAFFGALLLLRPFRVAASAIMRAGDGWDGESRNG